MDKKTEKKMKMKRLRSYNIGINHCQTSLDQLGDNPVCPISKSILINIYGKARYSYGSTVRPLGPP